MYVTNQRTAVYHAGLAYQNFSTTRNDRISRNQEKVDTVALSLQAKAYNMIRNELKSVSDVREEKVAIITKQMQDGNYFSPTGREIANRMFSKALV